MLSGVRSNLSGRSKTGDPDTARVCTKESLYFFEPSLQQGGPAALQAREGIHGPKWLGCDGNKKDTMSCRLATTSRRNVYWLA